MNINLANKKALVCGSTQGIGKAIAIELAELGAEVILFARNKELLTKTKSELPVPNGQQHDILIADFTKPDEVSQAVNSLPDKGHEIHILVNNTGGPPAGLAIDADISDFRIAFNQHLINNQILVKSLLPGMKKAGYGRIINVISTSVKTPIPGLGVSNTIRGAVASWAKTLASELGPFGITVNNILPGFTQTDRLKSLVAKRAKDAGKSYDEMESLMKSNIPLNRFAETSELAAMAGFLASPAASYVTGTSIRVDGGITPSI